MSKPECLAALVASFSTQALGQWPRRPFQQLTILRLEKGTPCDLTTTGSVRVLRAFTQK
jgi:hypothetical protein